MTGTTSRLQILMSTDTVGGVWTYALELAEALAAYDVSISLATMGARLTADQRRNAARLDNVTVFESQYRLEWMEDAWDDVAQAGTWLWEIARDTKPDLVHLNHLAHGASHWHAPCLVVAHSCVLSWHQAVRGLPAGTGVGPLSRDRQGRFAGRRSGRRPDPGNARHVAAILRDTGMLGSSIQNSILTDRGFSHGAKP